MTAGDMNQQTKTLSTIRVLIADPDESLLEIYRDRLPDDFDVMTAASEPACIARLNEGVPDVLVLEPQLPFGGGEGVLAMMQAAPRLANVPVMVLTSCRDPTVLRSVASFPIRAYYVKPLKVDGLAMKLRRLLERHRDQLILER